MSSDSNNIKFGTYENTVGEVVQLTLLRGDKHCRTMPLSEYAELYSVSIETARRYIDEGKLIGIKIGSRWFVQHRSFASMENSLDEFPF